MPTKGSLNCLQNKRKEKIKLKLDALWNSVKYFEVKLIGKIVKEKYFLRYMIPSLVSARRSSQIMS